MKILIPIDGSIYSDNAVAFVSSRTALIGREPHIVLLNVQAPLPARASRLVTSEALEDYYKEESEKAFKPARKILKKANLDVEEVSVVGNPAEAIADYADDMDADLIIMGSHGRSALKGLLLAP
jgi:nucleotide-binding universal stress UspA family protein